MMLKIENPVLRFIAGFATVLVLLVAVPILLGYLLAASVVMPANMNLAIAWFWGIIPALLLIGMIILAAHIMLLFG